VQVPIDHIICSDTALAAAAAEFRTTLGAIGLTQGRAARLFNVTPRHIRRWGCGSRCLPHAVSIILRLLAVGAVTIDQVEQAAASVLARTNGSAEPALPALLVEPVPAPAFANPGLSTAEKVYALTPGTCRWPTGDPQRPDFHFCGDPAAEPPYCGRHRALAYLAPRAGARFVAYGYQPRPPVAEIERSLGSVPKEFVSGAIAVGGHSVRTASPARRAP
jgi:hypothetical protein